MEDRWFVYAEGSLSADAVRSVGNDQEAHPEKVRDSNRHPKELEVFEVSFSNAKWLQRSVRDGGQPWTLRFFRHNERMIFPIEGDPLNRKSRRVEALKRAVKARVKREETKQ